MKKKYIIILAILIIFILAFSLIYVYFLKKPITDNQSDNFDLRVGQSLTYKNSASDLKIKLLEIGKIGDALNSPKFSDEQWQNFSQNSCDSRISCREYFKNVANDTYYLLDVENLIISDCNKENLFLFKDGNSGAYSCPSIYQFSLNPDNSDNLKINFSVNYISIGVY
ncbi:MAG: hypothetical protein PHT51_02675 [Patescibacteria group bacterium]|nr:hypothetical protein [Methanothrix sp.]MDD4332994.1 hypothetical protein [Patescibacteria group bacterium]MDD4663267.1 hypothetical protein [Caldisericia bacterium]